MRTKVNTKEMLTAKKTYYMHNKTIKHHMAWIESYENQIEAVDNELDNMCRKIKESKESPMCSICDEFQTSHTLVTGRGYFHETGICDVCCNKIREFNDYQKDVIDYITIH